MYQLLNSQFEETKESLKSVEENIRRLTGRDPDSFTAAGNIKWKKEAGPFVGKPNGFQARKRTIPFKQNEMEEDAIAEEEEDSADEDIPKKKPSLQSTVVATHKSAKSRKDTLEEQKGDKRILARNRRMFGMILGTLQKFQSEESRRKDQSLKRAEIDKKVEEAAEKEKELMKKEKEQLFVTRKDKQIQIRCLEKKLEIAEVYEVWEQNQKMLANFIQTASKPQIMFLPAKHNMKSLKCLDESKERIAAMIQTNRVRVEKELAEIEECYRRDNVVVNNEVGDKENIMIFERQESQDGIMETEDDISLDKKADDLPSDEERNNENPEITSNQDSLMDFSENSVNLDRHESSFSDVKSTEDHISDPKPVDDHDEFEPIYD